MNEIAAASAMQWNVELDRGLRCQKPGSQCEAILKLALRLQQWSREPPASPVIARLYNLDIGQDSAFLNAIMMHLTEAFRTGDNFVRLCVLKILLQEKKSRRSGVQNLQGKGLITKERIPNHAEVLKRIKTIIKSGDHTAKALALLVTGCLAELAKDSIDVHRLVFEAIHSPYECEVRAALCAIGCFCEISDHFSLLAFDRISDILMAIETPSKVRIQAIFVLPHMHISHEASLKAYEVGKALMLRMPVEEVVLPVLEALSRLASKCSLILAEQVDLLLNYICSDPRSTVHIVALKCLTKLAKRYRGRISFQAETVEIMLSILENPQRSFHLKALALQALRQFLPFGIMVADANHLIRLLSIAELSVMRVSWPQVETVLGLLVDLVYDLEKARPEVIRKADSEMGIDKFSISQGTDVDMLSSSFKVTNDSIYTLDMPTRVILLICDRLALLANSWHQEDFKHVSSDCLSNKTASNATRVEENCRYLCALMLKLAMGCSQSAYVIVDCLCGMVEAFLKELQKMKNGQENTSSLVLEEVPKVEHAAEPVNKKRGSAVVITRSPLLKSMCLCIGESGLTSMLDEECSGKTIRRLSELMIHVINVDVPTNLAKILLPVLLKCKSCAMPNEARLISNKVHDIAETFIQVGDHWSAYKVVTLAACHGLWMGLEPLMEQISCKAQSGGSLFWLKALTRIYTFESSIQSECDQIKYATNASDLILIDSYTKERPRDSLNLNLGKAIARSLGSVRSADSSLAAAVKHHRNFEFQRQLLSLRASFIHTAGELLGLLGPVCVDFKASDVDMICHSKFDAASLNDDSMKPLVSRVEAVAMKAKAKAAELYKLSTSFDILRVSNMGMDKSSANQLCFAALGCSFISFSTIYCLSGLQSPDTTKDLRSLSTGEFCLNDIYQRMDGIHEEGSPELLSLMLKPGNILHRSSLVGRWDSSGSILEKKILGFMMRAIKEVVDLQRDDSSSSSEVPWIALARGIHKLKLIVEQWLCIPWSLPRHFFCTRPSVGIEVFTENKVTIPQGAMAAINLCFQLRNLGIDGDQARARKLCCALRLKPSSEVHHKEFYAGWRSSWLEDDKSDRSASKVSIIEALMERVCTFDGSTASYRADTADSTQGVRCDVNEKGQGFSSCTISTFDLGCGLFHIDVVAVCMDSRGHVWMLHPMADGPTVRVTSAARID